MRPLLLKCCACVYCVLVVLVPYKPDPYTFLVDTLSSIVAVLANHTFRQTINLPQNSHQRLNLSFRHFGKEFDYLFFAGPKPPSVE